MYRILSIDGGGIKGVFPSSFLASLEESLNEGDNISNYFDLIVGTSTGGIIALALGLGFSAKETLSIYEELSSEVFKVNSLLRISPLHAIYNLIFSKYSSKKLKKVLLKKFESKKLQDSIKRLVIPSVNLETGEVHIFKTAHHERFKMDYKEFATNVALAAASAPTYFSAHRSSDGMPLIDGGMWANNPTGFAVVEAIGVLGWDNNSLKVLSLGCTSEALNVGIGRRMPMGLLYWGYKKAVNVFMSSQSSASIGMSKLLAGHNNVFRIDPVVPNRRFGLDTTKEMNSLKGLGKSEARKNMPVIESVFLQEHVKPFKSIYYDD